MSGPEDRVKTRSALKLLRKEDQPGKEFKPTHRSTDVEGTINLHPYPFARSPRLRTSPERYPHENHQQQGNKEEGTSSNTKTESMLTKKDAQKEPEEMLTPLHGLQAEPIPINNRERLPSPIRNMDVTISASLDTPKTPTLPKFLCPPTFEPRTGNIVEFIKKYERTAAAVGTTL